MERQSPTQTPQFYVLENGNRKQITENKDLFPDLTVAQKVRVPIERADGLAAVTTSDNANIVTARIAKLIYRVPQVVTQPPAKPTH